MYDLHIHSTYSDGSSGIEEIFSMANQKGLKGIAITDHDSILGLKKSEEINRKYNMKFISGLEVTCKVGKDKLHVLAYNINSNSEELIEYSYKILNFENKISRERIKLLHNIGIEIEEKEFFKESKGGPLYRGKLLKTLCNYGYLKEEEIMKSIPLYFGKGGKCEADMEFQYYNFEDTIKLIKRNEGIPILAHPMKIKRKNEGLYKELINSNLIKGIEVYHPSANEKEQNELMEIVKERGLIFTGGSDYHGIYNKKECPIGHSVVNKMFF